METFEDYAEAQGWEVEEIQESHKEKRPDYILKIDGSPVLAEIKFLEEGEHDALQKRLRRRIRSANEQLRSYQLSSGMRVPLMVILQGEGITKEELKTAFQAELKSWLSAAAVFDGESLSIVYNEGASRPLKTA